MNSRTGLKEARRIVVKVGTRALLGSDQDVDRAALARLLEELVRVRKEGRFVVLVSSGAIGLGFGRLGYEKRPGTIPELQASASVGQSHLMHAYNAILNPLGTTAAQLLLTHDDFHNRSRYLNLRNTLGALHDSGALPIINENDVVAVDEIRFGDNDILAALVANAIDADVTVLFSDVKGVFKGDHKLDVVEGEIDESLVRKTERGLGSGGMQSKIEAARQIASAGGAVIVAHGKEDSLEAILRGDPVGTLFVPTGDRLGHRKRWIAFSAREAGSVTVDAGAAKALLDRGKSLLSVGITACEGDFEAGDAVLVQTPDGRAIAKGLSNYSSVELKRIMGRKSSEIASILGAREYDEVIHRDNLAPLEGVTK